MPHPVREGRTPAQARRHPERLVGPKGDRQESIGRQTEIDREIFKINQEIYEITRTIMWKTRA